MGNFSVGYGIIKTGIKTIFSRGGAAKGVEKALSHQPMTKTFTDTRTGIVTMEREFATKTKNGEPITRLFKVETETLENGSKVTRTHVWSKSPKDEYHFGGGGDAIDRTKTVERKANGILGGDTVTINKDYKETFGMSANQEKFVKEYNTKGQVGHKEVELNYVNGHKIQAKQDMVYDEIPLTSSAADMYQQPVTHTKYKHLLAKKRPEDTFFRESSNYGNFKNQTTAIEAKRLETKLNAENLLAQETAAKLTAEKAAVQLAAARPRINVGKVLNGLNVEELKVVEKTLENGAVKRYYFAPGNNKPVIKTFDQGILHKEWIHNGKDDIIYLKQVGSDTPYIYQQKGNYKHIQTIDEKGQTVNQQYFTNGKERYRNDRTFSKSEQYDNDAYLGTIKNPNYERDIFNHNKYYADCPEVTPPVEFPNFRGYNKLDMIQGEGRVVLNVNDLTRIFSSAVENDAKRTMYDTIKTAKDNFVVLKDLTIPFKA